MKTIFKILAGASILASFAACNDKADFLTYPYARFDASDYNFNEDAGTVTIPIYADKGASGSVNFEIVEGSAKQGVDFTIEPANGVVAIAGGGGSITVNIINHEGELTGDTSFGIKITGTSEGLTLGGIYETSVKIKDIDHPLTDLFGDYTFKALSADWGDDDNIEYYKTSWTMTMAPVEGELEQIAITNISAFSVAYSPYLDEPMVVIGTVSADKKTITIPVPQETTSSADAWDLDENFVLYLHGGVDGEYITSEGVITFTQQEDGSWTTLDSYGISTPTDILDYPDLFFSYAAIASELGASEDYPTCFVKK